MLRFGGNLTRLGAMQGDTVSWAAQTWSMLLAGTAGNGTGEQTWPAVYRQVVELADPATASFVIPGGSSGDPASPNFDDQLAAWARQQRIAMFPSPD